MSKYIHEDKIHNPESAEILVPYILDLMDINSVVDFGCGLGNFIRTFKNLGVNEILGLDGPWVEKDKIYKNINPGEFLVVDLESPIKLNKKYDLALCLEVAEHLSPESEGLIVESLMRASDNILFSAAIPQQGGQNHLNEQWLSHWVTKFATHDFVPVDILRRKIWNDKRIKWWYRQNIIFFVHKNSELAGLRSEVIDIVHPELFIRKVEHTKKLKTEIQLLKLENEKLSQTYNNHKKLTNRPFELFKLLIKSIFKG